MQKRIRDDEINYELTEKIKKEPKYEVYKNWLKSNGVIWRDIDFPVAFGPTGVVGVAAARDIPVCQGIIAIPNKLLVTITKVKNGEMSQMMKEHPEQFDDFQNPDADFNVLALFLLREKIKGKDSYYAPLIDVLDNSTILLHWREEDVKELEDPYILKESKEFEQEMDKTWDEFRAIFEKFQDLFPLDKVTKEDFFWCYEAVMTRCFGWSLPTTMLVPMADFMNHSADGTTHYIVNKEFERHENEAPETYVMKKKKVDLSIFNDEAMLLNEEDKKYFHRAYSDRTNYIRKHMDLLSEDQRDQFNAEDYHKKEIKQMVRTINLKILKQNKEKQVWELPWFDSSDDEDNDTEEEEEDADTGKQAFESTFNEEIQKSKLIKKDENNLNKKFADEETKENYSKTTDISNKSEGVEKGSEGDDESDGDDEDEVEQSEEEDEQIRLEKEKYKYGKEILGENFSPTKYMKHHMSKYEREEVEKIKKRKINEVSKPKRVEDEEDDEYEEQEDDSDWEWFQDSDENNYFVVATHPYLYYKRGDQIFNCYGRRTNRFLLMWYGFCLKENKYNSLSFRLWMNRKSLSNQSIPKKVLFQDYITSQEWEAKAIGGEENSNPTELTKEFRVKSSRFCEDVLSYLRAQLLLSYKGPDLRKILVTIPSSIPYESFVIDYAISLFIEINNQFRTILSQDEEILKDTTLDWKKRFAVTYRAEQKRIANMQIKLLKILLNFMEKLKTGVPFKDIYMEYLPEFDADEDEFIENRRKIANYLKLFYHNYS